MSTVLSDREASVAAPGWRLLADRLHLQADLGDFDRAMAFVNDVAEIARTLAHHPDIEIRWSRVHLSVRSHDVGAITDRDVRLATRISGLLAARGVHPDHHRLSVVQVAVDALDRPAVRPFWAAVLGRPMSVVDSAEASDLELPDPDLLGPTVWFQQMDAPRPQRNRIHLDVWVAHDEAQHRLAAALAAGGRLVDDAYAPAFRVLADAEGNEACLCTWQRRDPQ